MKRLMVRIAGVAALAAAGALGAAWWVISRKESGQSPIPQITPGQFTKKIAKKAA